MAALSESGLEDSALDHFFSDILHQDIQSGVLAKMVVQYPVATGLAAAAGSSVGAAAAVLAENEGGLRAGLRDLKETLIDELKNAHKTLFIELTKTFLTDGDLVNQDSFATFAVHDAVASEVAAPMLDGSQARFMHIDAIKKKLHSNIEEIEVSLSSLEKGMVNLTTIRAGVSMLKKSLDRQIESLEDNFDSIYDGPNGKKESKDKIMTLYRLQKSFQDNFSSFKEKRDDFLAEKDHFLKSVASTEKEIKSAPKEILSIGNLVQSKVVAAQQKTHLFPKIEKWIKKTEPSLHIVAQRIAVLRKRYNAKKGI